MRTTLFFILSLPLLVSCHENLEERAAREAREYTEKFCPTPVVNYIRTDSVAFDKTTKTYNYYCTLTGKMDNYDIIKQNEKQLTDGLGQSIKENTNIRAYKKAGFNFAYTIKSEKDPKKTLFYTRFTPKEYGTTD